VIQERKSIFLICVCKLSRRIIRFDSSIQMTMRKFLLLEWNVKNIYIGEKLLLQNLISNRKGNIVTNKTKSDQWFFIIFIIIVLHKNSRVVTLLEICLFYVSICVSLIDKKGNNWLNIVIENSSVLNEFRSLSSLCYSSFFFLLFLLDVRTI
jgi:hypothetical protein